VTQSGIINFLKKILIASLPERAALGISLRWIRPAWNLSSAMERISNARV